MPYAAAVEALGRWISWARRCRIPSFVKLQKSIKHRARILAAIEHNLYNGLIESTNTKIRPITRMAFGFKSPHALIALALVPGQTHKHAAQCLRDVLVDLTPPAVSAGEAKLTTSWRS